MYLYGVKCTVKHNSGELYRNVYVVTKKLGFEEAQKMGVEHLEKEGCTNIVVQRITWIAPEHHNHLVIEGK